MKAAVYVQGTSDPQPIPKFPSRSIYTVEDLDIAPEYALRIAAWALQSIQSSSRCHASRMTAKSALEFLAEVEVLPVDGRGALAPVKFPGKPENIRDIWKIAL